MALLTGQKRVKLLGNFTHLFLFDDRRDQVLSVFWVRSFCWFPPGLLVYWCTGVLVYWCTGVLVYGVLMYCFLRLTHGFLHRQDFQHDLMKLQKRINERNGVSPTPSNGFNPEFMHSSVSV